ncbi:MAG: aldo/keto reductase [Caulobacter sp.]
MSQPLTLDTYRMLGRSGLKVSPLCLGTMTFGAPWGADEAASRQIFDAYVEAGGNFVDTADYYAGGLAETFIGDFAGGKRDSLVLATKYSLAAAQGDPNAGGNHRKNMVRAVEASLKRLKTDYIDLFYLHVWDGLTPVDEIMRGFDDLVRAGKVTYVGVSDTPAWQVSRMQMLAELRGWSPFVALQIEYNLLERTVERELIPMAAELGLGLLPWSPLAGGLLSGKYGGGAPSDSAGRSKALVAMGKVDERAHQVAAAVNGIAGRTGRSAAEVALAWVLANPAVTAPIVGARTPEQFSQNLRALEMILVPEDLAELNGLSAVEAGFPYSLFGAGHIRQALSAGARIAQRR